MMSKNTPAISFIIPIYNVELYLAECIESVLKQDIDKEIILINDGSTDTSLSIALEYANKHSCITLITSHNKSVSTARNNGIKIARGEYIYFIDSDDYLLGDHFSTIYDCASKNNIDIIRLQAQYHFQTTNDHKIIKVKSPIPHTADNEAFLLNSRDYLTRLVKQRVWVPAICWSLIKRDFLLKNNIFFEENIRAEDQLFYIQLLSCQKNATLLEMSFLTYNYRLRPNSTMTSQNNVNFFIDHFRIVEKITQWIKNNEFDTKITQVIYTICGLIYYTAAQIYNGFTPDLRQENKHYFTPEVLHFIQEYALKDKIET